MNTRTTSLLLPGLLITGLMVPFAPGAKAAAFYISEFGTPGSLGTAGVANTTNTFDADSAFTNPAGMTRQQTDGLDYALGATLMYAGEAKVDQTSQGVRFKGKFDTNLILFVGGTIHYVF